MDFADLRSLLVPVFIEHGVSLSYLFGSRSTGTNREDSDFDIGVMFSNLDRGTDAIDREIALEGIISDLLAPLRSDITCLQRASMALRFEVVRQGLVLFSKNEALRTDFEETVIRDYLDFAPVLMEYLRIAKEGVLNGRPAR